LETGNHTQNTLNPYITNRPISEPSAFFGRKDLLSWVRQRLIKGDRVLLLHGVRRIGKTSFLLQLPHHVPAGFLPIHLDLKKLSHLADSEANSSDGQATFAWAFCQSVAQEVTTAHSLSLTTPGRAEFVRYTNHALQEFLADLRQVLGNNILLLMLDDLDALPKDGVGPRFIYDLVDQAQKRRRGLRFLIAARSFDDLLAGLGWGQQAPTQRMAPLNTIEAQDLLKSLAAGRLLYDPAAVRRIAELASGHPYYLQLLGYTLFNRCLASGEVSLPDVSAVLEELLPLPFDEFNAWWAASLPAERVILALLGELRGQGGVVTGYEIHKALTRRGVRVKRDGVEGALQSLAERQILEHLGAISYRARIELFRAWLPYHADLQKELKAARWRMRRQAIPRVGQEMTDDNIVKWFTWAVVTAAVLAVLFLVFRLPQEAKTQPTATPFPSPLFTSTPSPSRSAIAKTAMPALTRTGLTATTPPAIRTSEATISSAMPPLPSQGRLLYMRKVKADDPWQLYMLDANGTNPRPVTGGHLGEAHPAWAPHGRSVAFVSEWEDNKEIYVMQLDGSDLTNLTRHPADDWTPAWSPDGQWIAFASFRDDNWELYAVHTDGTDLVRLTENEVSDLSPVWSPDGKRLAFASKRDGNWEIYRMSWPDAAITRLTHDPGADTVPAWSPDGQWIAFESARDGDAEIYTMRADGSEQRNLTNWPYADEHGPVWSPDGQWIALFSNRDGDWDIYVIDRQGQNLTNLTDDDANNQSPAWSP
jgi:Tol biopolymer transport system component